MLSSLQVVGHEHINKSDYCTISTKGVARMRSDDETMSELHQKVDDLRERLWNICDERKASAETERQDIINDGWLDDRLGIVSNQYITQMQVDAKANIDS